VVLTSSIMVLFTKDSGLKMVLDMVEAFKFGKMVQNTKVIGQTIWLMAKEG